jgi:hypothetical protein
MTIEKISIIDSLGQSFVLPKTFEMRTDPTGRRSSRLNVAFAHGARDVSDGMFTPKMVEVTGKIWADSDSAYNVKWDALAEHLLKDNIRIQNRDRQIYLLKVVSISHTFPSQVAYHYGEVSITFLAADPFWYSKSAVQKQIVITSSPKLFQFDIGGKMETWPVITIANSADNFNFTLINKTDADRTFQIIDTGAANGTSIVIDCKAGTVKRGATNIISAFSGLFLRLLGGRTNEFSYTGANCTITMNYFTAWI